MDIYIGAYTHDVFGEHPTGSRGIVRAALDPATGALTRLEETPCVNPSFVTLSPDGRRLLACVEKKRDGALALFRVEENGALSPLDTLPLSGMECCFAQFAPDGSFAAAAHYGSGEFFTVGLGEAGFQGVRFSHFDEGAGPVADRQERAHVHSARLIPALSMAVVCDLGNDTVSFYRYGPGGAMAPHEIPAVAAPAGTGPRHSEFSPDGARLYVTGELSNQLLVYALEEGAYRLRQRVSTLPEEFTGFNTAADLHLDGKGRLIASNRGHDSLVTYDLAPDGALRNPRWVPTGKTPRQFTVAGDWLLCACQDGGVVQVFRLDGDGVPQGPVSQAFVPGAVCVAVGR